MGSQLAKFGDPFGGDSAFFHKSRIGAEQCIGEEFRACDFHTEGLLEAEENVQKVDRFGSQVPFESRFEGDFIIVDPQGIHQNVTNFLEDFRV